MCLKSEDAGTVSTPSRNPIRYLPLGALVICFGVFARLARILRSHRIRKASVTHRAAGSAGKLREWRGIRRILRGLCGTLNVQTDQGPQFFLRRDDQPGSRNLALKTVQPKGDDLLASFLGAHGWKKRAFTGTGKEVRASKAEELLAGFAPLYKSLMAVQTDEGPLGTLAKSLKLGQQAAGCRLVVEKLTSNVTMSDQPSCDPHTQYAGSQLEGVQTDTLTGTRHRCQLFREPEKRGELSESFSPRSIGSAGYGACRRE